MSDGRALRKMGCMVAFASFMYALAFASWFFTAVELCASVMLAKWAFGLGIVALRSTDAAERPSSAPSKGETEHGRFRRLDDGCFLVRAKWPLFSTRSKTPFPLRGTVRFADGKAVLEGRVPIGPMGIVGSILLFIVASCSGPNIPLGQTAFACGAVAAMTTVVVAVSLQLERSRLSRAYREMLTALVQDRAQPGS